MRVPNVRFLSQLRLRLNRRIRIGLVVLTSSKHRAVLLAAHDAPNEGKTFAGMDEFRLNDGLSADGRGTEVSDVEGAGDAEEAPVTWLGDEGERHARSPVKERGYGTAVHVRAAVTVPWLDGEGERRRWVRAIEAGGDEAEVWANICHPSLCWRRWTMSAE